MHVHAIKIPVMLTACGLALPAADPFAPGPAAGVIMRGYLGSHLGDGAGCRIKVQDITAVVMPCSDKRVLGDGDWRCEHPGTWCASMALGSARQPAPIHPAKDTGGFSAMVAIAVIDGHPGGRTQEHRIEGRDARANSWFWQPMIGMIRIMTHSGGHHSMKPADRGSLEAIHG